MQMLQQQLIKSKNSGFWRYNDITYWATPFSMDMGGALRLLLKPNSIRGLFWFHSKFAVFQYLGFSKFVEICRDQDRK